MDRDKSQDDLPALACGPNGWYAVLINGKVLGWFPERDDADRVIQKFRLGGVQAVLHRVDRDRVEAIDADPLPIDRRRRPM